MRRWLAPAVSAVLAAGALVGLHVSQPGSPDWETAPGKPRTVVRTALERVDAAPDETVVSAQGLRLRLSGRRARLESVGPQSDALLAMFDHVCAGDLRPSSMKQASELQARVVDGSAQALGREPVTLLLSFEAEPEERYAELYVAVEPALRAVSLQERDDRHCPAVVRFLGRP